MALHEESPRAVSRGHIGAEVEQALPCRIYGAPTHSAYVRDFSKFLGFIQLLLCELYDGCPLQLSRHLRDGGG